MISKEELRQLVFTNLLNESKKYLDNLQKVPWDVNLGIALLIYDPDNFGLVTNSIPKIEQLTDQLMTNWSRYQHCETTTLAITRAYDRYLNDEEGDDFDFDRTVYDSILETLRKLKLSYDLHSDIFAVDFFWAIRFADPTQEQQEFALFAFRELNSAELFLQFKGKLTQS